jgi:TetR/AcrR family transcriptional regulator, mexJK operon transcriptional repressor
MKARSAKKNASFGRPRTEDQEAKRRHLIQEARTELLKTGGTDFRLNQVLKAAGGSKTTLYTYFGGRDGLLEAVLRKSVAETLTSEKPPSEKSPKAILTALAMATYDVVFSPETLALYRMAIAESQNNPQLSKMFYESGPAVARKILGEVLADLQTKKVLQLDNLPLAADMFFGMLLEGPLMNRMLHLPRGKEDLSARAKLAVDLFLKAFSRA